MVLEELITLNWSPWRMKRIRIKWPKLKMDTSWKAIYTPLRFHRLLLHSKITSLLIVINLHSLFIWKIIHVLQLRGGSVFSTKIRWSQKILFHDGQLSLCVPFSFPSYVNPAGKRISKKEKIFLKVNSGFATEVLLCKTTSHPLKVKLTALLQISVWPPLDLSNIILAIFRNYCAKLAN